MSENIVIEWRLGHDLIACQFRTGASNCLARRLLSQAGRSCCRARPASAGLSDCRPYCPPHTRSEATLSETRIRRAGLDPGALGAAQHRRAADRSDHVENLGPQHLIKRSESRLGAGRNESPVRAHRRRRRLRQDQGAVLSCDEPQLAGADPRRGGRLHDVGIERDRSLSRGETFCTAGWSPAT